MPKRCVGTEINTARKGLTKKIDVFCNAKHRAVTLLPFETSTQHCRL